ncbi:MAG: tRNA (N6-isopentenyl adenosine(37)-C2)-methylthiotransferase MiaB [Bacteroidales bacterium]|nr:tRNA (N6-isopentenyl adenosine(37)-C2)-methylthiotransferase MiaB [Bacteroidales bacterium]
MYQFYIETYGCQMNVYDSELISSILISSDFKQTHDDRQANVIIINTCSIRKTAEDKVFNRLKHFESRKKKKKDFILGVVGCMAQRIKEDIINNFPFVDFVIGPDEYHNIVKAIIDSTQGIKSIKTVLNSNETYEDIIPHHFLSNGISTYVAITRGCENFCSYCIVPYVRGKERSKKPEVILKEIEKALLKGIKEIILIGQNVDSYRYEEVDFADLLQRIAINFPGMRIRFSTNHPKDISNKVLETVAKYPNICKHIHLPVQSGSNKILALMNRKYTREYYLERIKAIKKIIPSCAITTDIMVGFCNETDEDFKETLSLMNEVIFDHAFMFKYNPREGTYAYYNLKDNVPEEIKIERLKKVINLQNKLGLLSKKNDIGKTYEVLVEGTSKKNKSEYMGRNSQNKVVVFSSPVPIEKGTYVNVFIEKVTSATLIGKIIK